PVVVAEKLRRLVAAEGRCREPEDHRQGSQRAQPGDGCTSSTAWLLRGVCVHDVGVAYCLPQLAEVACDEGSEVEVGKADISRLARVDRQKVERAETDTNHA